MSGKQGQRSKKAVEIPVRYEETFMAQLDGRSNVARELRDNFHELTTDLGGLSELSYQERSMCKRIIHLERQVKKKEERQAHDEEVDDYVLLYQIRTLRELFGSLGYKRRSKIVKTWAEALSQKEPVS